MPEKEAKTMMGFRASAQERQKVCALAKAMRRTPSDVLRRLVAEAQWSGISDVVFVEAEDAKGIPSGAA